MMSNNRMNIKQPLIYTFALIAATGVTAAILSTIARAPLQQQLVCWGVVVGVVLVSPLIARIKAK